MASSKASRKNARGSQKNEIKKTVRKKKVMTAKGPMAGAIKALGKTRDGKNQRIDSVR